VRESGRQRDRERDNDRECVSERERVGPCSTQYDIQNALQYYVRDYQKPLQIFIYVQYSAYTVCRADPAWWTTSDTSPEVCNVMKCTVETRED
jgi:uncharacterized protein YqjF (DUF2071 family)